MNVGFVGLGAMGALIVPRLMTAGHKVTGWNRSRDKAEPLIAAGMAFAATPRAVAEASDIVFSIVTDSAAVKAVALGPDGIVSGLRKGGIYIDMSTIEPDASRAIAEQFTKSGSIMTTLISSSSAIDRLLRLADPTLATTPSTVMTLACSIVGWKFQILTPADNNAS